MTASYQKRVVLGTAGHIDHGKTALVRALTGIDTDRLKEEKERGITIELGFARLQLPSGSNLAIVDVPGHERFVKNMVAGASGIDLVLLVVAADEGVMPQTREHLDICSLLRVKAGMVALTKADAVDNELLELAREDVASLVGGTFLEGAPIVPVSSITGEGLDELVRCLDDLTKSVPQRHAKGLFRLPVDRVFTMRGFGTVVTGTLISGSVRREEEVQILPGGARGKVRGVQVHGETTGRASAGQRTALNLAGLDVAEISRGDTVVHPDSLEPTHMLDAKIELLSSSVRPLRNRDRFRLHVATQEAPVVVALLDRDELLPGESAYVQIRSPARIVGCPGDRFVLRLPSPSLTVGGGIILDHSPRRHKGQRPDVIRQLGVLDAGDLAQKLGVLLENRGHRGIEPLGVQAAFGLPLEEARNQLQGAVRSGVALVTDRKAQIHHHSSVVQAIEEEALRLLGAFHAEHPLKRGLGVEEFRTKFPRHFAPKLVEFVLDRLAAAGRVAVEGDTVRRSEFTARLSADDEDLRRRILKVLEAKGYEAPSLDDMATALNEHPRALAPVLNYLVSEGLLTRTKEGFYFETARLRDLADRVIDLLRDKGEIGVTDIKNITGTTRKYTIPLLEYLDSQRVTARRGDVRVLGAKGRA
jgi:selenocysteine-specific elongation factor